MTILKKAWRVRETAEMQDMRRHFKDTIELRMREILKAPADADLASRCFLDHAALYAGQGGLTRDAFLAYAAEAFDLYLYLSDGFPNYGNPVVLAAKIALLKEK